MEGLELSIDFLVERIAEGVCKKTIEDLTRDYYDVMTKVCTLEGRIEELEDKVNGICNDR